MQRHLKEVQRKTSGADRKNEDVIALLKLGDKWKITALCNTHIHIHT